jgi:hypothetical protein
LKEKFAKIDALRHINPEVFKTTIHEAVTEKLGYRKLCARWVPKMLTITKETDGIRAEDSHTLRTGRR